MDKRTTEQMTQDDAELEVRKVVGATDLPLADVSRPWDAAAARRRIKQWATKADGKLDPAKLKQVHFYYDDSKPAENITAYKLLFCDVINGRVMAVPRGIFAVAGVLMGARGGVDIPQAEQERIKAKVAKYYRRLDRTPPWERGADGEVAVRDFQEPQVRVRQGNLQPQSYDADSHTIEVVWSTGARVRRGGWGQVYDEELVLEGARLDRLNSQGVFLAAHDSRDLRSVIGRVVPGTVEVRDGEAVATVKLSDLPEDQPLVRKIVTGLVPGVSVGYKVYREEIIQGGGDGGVDLVRVVDWEPYEISAVALPADAGAAVRSDDVVSDTEVDMNKERKDKDIQQTDGAPASHEERQAAQDDKVQAEAIMAERARVNGILTAARKLGAPQDLVDQLIRDGVSLDQARERLIDWKAEQDAKSDVSHVHVERDEQETQARGMMEWLLYRGNPQLFELTEHARPYVGMTLFDLARMSVEARGINTKGLSRTEIAHLALRPHRTVDDLHVRQGYLSTSDFPYLLAAVAEKTLRKAYEEAPRTFQPFCSRRVVPNFKPQREVLLSEAPDLEVIGEGGEYKHATLVDGQETWQLATYGRIIAITRQAIINDDLGAFTNLPQKLGAAAARKENDVVWALITSNPSLSDGKALFHADHGNLTSPGAAPSVSEIAKGRTAMRKQTGPNGAILNIIPRFLIVPAALETVAEQLVTDITPVQSDQVVPKAIKTLQVIAEPRLDANSAAAWYLAADPSQIDTIVYGYLEGQEGPYVETQEAFDIDGVKFKVRHDFGAGVVDYRGLYKNAGA